MAQVKRILKVTDSFVDAEMLRSIFLLSYDKVTIEKKNGKFVVVAYFII